MPGWWLEAFWPMQSIIRVTNTIFLLFAAAVFCALVDISDARMESGNITLSAHTREWSRLLPAGRYAQIQTGRSETE
jgi:hypothetical protein